MLNDNKPTEKSQTVLFSVYVIWCNKTDMHYVGVTSQKIYRRICQHKRGKKQFVDTEIQRIGWENWDWWVVERGVPSDIITEREQFWVAFFDCVYPKGYNKTCGGIKFFKHSEETKARMSANCMGEKGHFYGKHHTAETKARMSADCMGEKGHFYGKHHTAETKARMSDDRTGEKNHFYGKHHTDDTKAKMRGRRFSEEHKAKLRGRKRSEETRAKMRQSHLGKSPANKGVPCSEEQKAILREKALARAAAKRAAKAVAEENLFAANSTPTSPSTLLDAVILQKGLRSKIAVA